MPTHHTRLGTPAPFDWRLCLHGHGWIALAPHDFEAETARWHTALRLGNATVDAVARHDGAAIRLALTARRSLSKAQLAAARPDLLQVRQHLVEQRPVGQGAHHGHAVVDQCQRAVLEFPCRISLGMDVGDFFQLQCTF